MVAALERRRRPHSIMRLTLAMAVAVVLAFATSAAASTVAMGLEESPCATGESFPPTKFPRVNAKTDAQGACNKYMQERFCSSVIFNPGESRAPFSPMQTGRPEREDFSINVGFVGVLSGLDSICETTSHMGLLCAVKRSEASLRQLKINPVFANSLGLETGGISASWCLHQLDVPVMLGPSFSGAATGAATVGKILQIPVMGTTSTSASLTNRDTRTGFSTFARIVPNDFAQARALVGLARHFGWNSVMVVSMANDEYCTGVTEEFAARALEYGISVTDKLSFSRDARKKDSNEYASLVDRLKTNAAGTRVVLLVAYIQDARAILQAARAAGLMSAGWAWMGSDSWMDQAFSGSCGASVATAAHGSSAGGPADGAATDEKEGAAAEYEGENESEKENEGEVQDEVKDGVKNGFNVKTERSVDQVDHSFARGVLGIVPHVSRSSAEHEFLQECYASNSMNESLPNGETVADSRFQGLSWLDENPNWSAAYVYDATLAMYRALVSLAHDFVDGRVGDLFAEPFKSPTASLSTLEPTFLPLENSTMPPLVAPPTPRLAPTNLRVAASVFNESRRINMTTNEIARFREFISGPEGQRLMYERLLATDFDGATGRVRVNAKGERALAKYDIVNIQSEGEHDSSMVVVGTVEQQHGLKSARGEQQQRQGTEAPSTDASGGVVENKDGDGDDNDKDNSVMRITLFNNTAVEFPGNMDSAPSSSAYECIVDDLDESEKAVGYLSCFVGMLLAFALAVFNILYRNNKIVRVSSWRINLVTIFGSFLLFMALNSFTLESHVDLYQCDGVGERVRPFGMINGPNVDKMAGSSSSVGAGAGSGSSSGEGGSSFAVNRDPRMSSRMFGLGVRSNHVEGVCFTGNPECLRAAGSTVCGSRAWLFGVGYCLMFGSLFAKTYRISKLFSGVATKPKIGDHHVFFYVSLMVMPMVLFLAVWDSVFPHHVTFFVNEASRNENGTVYNVRESCSGGEFHHVFIMILSFYCLSLLAVGAFLAWSVKDVWIREVNDSTEVAISIYTIVVVGGLGFGVTMLLEDRTRSFLASNFSAWLCNSLVLCILFFPKVRQVYQRRGEDDITLGAANNHVNVHEAQNILMRSSNNDRPMRHRGRGGFVNPLSGGLRQRRYDHSDNDDDDLLSSEIGVLSNTEDQVTPDVVTSSNAFTDTKAHVGNRRQRSVGDNHDNDDDDDCGQ